VSARRAVRSEEAKRLMTIEKTSGLIDGDDQSLLGTGQLVSRTL
jgi:hypothetical protein